MPAISLTVFVDFTISETFARLARVRSAIRDAAGYDPRFDFWKPLREEIQHIHQTGAEPSSLRGILGGLADAKKRTSYPPAVEGYLRFVGRRPHTYFAPPRIDWEHDGLTVRVNPELGLVSAGISRAIKLYFSREPLSQNRTNLILALMEETLDEALPPGTRCAVLDVQRGRLYEPTREVQGVGALLRGEAAAFLQMWSDLGGPM